MVEPSCLVSTIASGAVPTGLNEVLACSATVGGGSSGSACGFFGLADARLKARPRPPLPSQPKMVSKTATVRALLGALRERQLFFCNNSSSGLTESKTYSDFLLPKYTDTAPSAARATPAPVTTALFSSRSPGIAKKSTPIRTPAIPREKRLPLLMPSGV